MPFIRDLFCQDFFPGPEPSNGSIPMGELLDTLFFQPLDDNTDFPIHGPNVVRFIEPLVKFDMDRLRGEVFQSEDGCADYFGSKERILDALEASGGQNRQRRTDLLKVAALLHDIGKTIRRANHPQVGANLMRSNDDKDALADCLVFENEGLDISQLQEHTSNRFKLIASVVQHHDKFGVVSTGEGSLPLFSDILFFTSNRGAIGGIKKNVTAVMLLNLADIAAVNTSANSAAAVKIARDIGKLIGPTRDRTKNQAQFLEYLEELKGIISQPSAALRISNDKIRNVLSDWKILVNAIEKTAGDRSRLKAELLTVEQNPSRGVERVQRILQEAAATSNANSLSQYVTLVTVESVLVNTLGPHRFEKFCRQLAIVSKFDYGLDFFKGLLCAHIRSELGQQLPPSAGDAAWRRLADSESSALAGLSAKQQTDIVSRLTTYVIRVLESLMNRYEPLLDCSTDNPRRFGFMLRDLTRDPRIRKSILDLLCVKHREDAALTWIGDEVTVWSMD